ncbi:MAG: CDP-alcohol phosphatidyltransferase family protein [Bacteroidota bacterium]
MKKWIPNILTLGNAACGFLALFFIFNEGKVSTACWLMLLAAVFDVFDGLVARALKVDGDLGTQLDSLADVISFGVAPSALLWLLLEFANALPIFKFGIPMLMVGMSVLRLARFNLDTEQTYHFKGLPTPANALFWMGMASLATAPHVPAGLFSLAHQPVLLAILGLIFSVLLNVDTPLLSLKFKDYSFGNNVAKYLLIISGFILLSSGVAFFGNVFVLLPFLLLLYLILSVVNLLIQKT